MDYPQDTELTMSFSGLLTNQHFLVVALTKPSQPFLLFRHILGYFLGHLFWMRTWVMCLFFLFFNLYWASSDAHSPLSTTPLLRWLFCFFIPSLSWKTKPGLWRVFFYKGSAQHMDTWNLMDMIMNGYEFDVLWVVNHWFSGGTGLRCVVRLAEDDAVRRVLKQIKVKGQPKKWKKKTEHCSYWAVQSRETDILSFLNRYPTKYTRCSPTWEVYG